LIFRERSSMDEWVCAADKALKVLTHTPPSITQEPRVVKSVRLMRVNYAGEIAAQGLYLGAGLIETDASLKQFYSQALEEERIHLDWCGNRVYSMGGSVSVFNPVWFAGAFVLGVGSRMLGAEYALGFVVETEKQVLAHLKSHIEAIPASDQASIRVLEAMISDEEAHANEAKSRGAKELPEAACQLMGRLGAVLTTLSAWS
jgi:3-demethoxyubiquinol 3-hydroxylase